MTLSCFFHDSFHLDCLNCTKAAREEAQRLGQCEAAVPFTSPSGARKLRCLKPTGHDGGHVFPFGDVEESC